MDFVVNSFVNENDRQIVMALSTIYLNVSKVKLGSDALHNHTFGKVTVIDINCL